mgnify:CR=1 FL=1
MGYYGGNLRRNDILHPLLKKYMNKHIKIVIYTNSEDEYYQ